MATDNEQLPSEFDVIVIGTGLTESIVSAAASRVGHKVLHIDPRDYYGGKWGTLCWETWTSGNFAKTPPRLDKAALRENNIEWSNDVQELEQVWYLDKDEEDQQPLQDKIAGLSRKFNIDIFPKVLMAREEIIKILIHSNVSRYLEFKCITKLFSSLLPPNEHTIEPIPLSRSDIFTTKTISLIEKRSLMKFIESIMKMKSKKEGDQEQDPSDEMETEDTAANLKTFEELSKECSLSKKVQHLLKSAVRTMDDCYFEMDSPEDESKNQLSGFNREFSIHCKRFLKSIGQYGNRTPFLWTLYGISEICQAFCRMSAIYGGIFILKRSFDSVTTCDQDGYKVKITSEGKEIKTKYLVVGPEVKLKEYWDDKSSSPKLRQGITLARAVLLTTGPRLQTTTKAPAAVPAPDDDPTNLSIHRLDDMDIIELDDTSLAVPKNYRLLQVTCPYRLSESSSPKALIESRLEPFVEFNYAPQLQPAAEIAPHSSAGAQQHAHTSEEGAHSMQEHVSAGPSRFAAPTRTVAIYGSYFLLNFSDDIQTSEDTKANIFSCSVSSTEITEHVDKAKAIFTKMFPTEDFLPKAPDPQDAHDENEIFPGEEDDRIGDDNDFGNVQEVQGPPPAVVHNGYGVNNEDPEEHMEEDP